jgi:hypothetical protein
MEHALVSYWRAIEQEAWRAAVRAVIRALK